MIRKGTLVRLRHYRTTARVIGRVQGVEGGLVLDRPLNGFRCWNVLDLVRAK